MTTAGRTFKLLSQATLYGYIEKMIQRKETKLQGKIWNTIGYAIFLSPSYYSTWRKSSNYRQYRTQLSSFRMPTVSAGITEVTFTSINPHHRVTGLGSHFPSSLMQHYFWSFQIPFTYLFKSPRRIDVSSSTTISSFTILLLFSAHFCMILLVSVAPYSLSLRTGSLESFPASSGNLKWVATSVFATVATAVGLLFASITRLTIAIWKTLVLDLVGLLSRACTPSLGVSGGAAHESFEECSKRCCICSWKE